MTDAIPMWNAVHQIQTAFCQRREIDNPSNWTSLFQCLWIIDILPETDFFLGHQNSWIQGWMLMLNPQVQWMRTQTFVRDSCSALSLGLAASWIRESHRTVFAYSLQNLRLIDMPGLISSRQPQEPRRDRTMQNSNQFLTQLGCRRLPFKNANDAVVYTQYVL